MSWASANWLTLPASRRRELRQTDPLPLGRVGEGRGPSFVENPYILGVTTPTSQKALFYLRKICAVQRQGPDSVGVAYEYL